MDLPILKAIITAGPVSSRKTEGSISTIGVLIEVEMEDGSRGLLPLSENAALVLAEELGRWSQGRGSR